jgi:hypothetical protein
LEMVSWPGFWPGNTWAREVYFSPFWGGCVLGGVFDCGRGTRGGGLLCRVSSPRQGVLNAGSGGERGGWRRTSGWGVVIEGVCFLPSGFARGCLWGREVAITGTATPKHAKPASRTALFQGQERRRPTQLTA